MIPNLNGLDHIGAYGNPWHGVYRGDATGTARLRLPNGTDLPGANWSGPETRLVEFAGMPAAEPTEAETAAGMEFRNYAILHGASGRYSPRSDMRIGHLAWLYRDGAGRVWRLWVVPVVEPGGRLITAYAVWRQRFGLFDLTSGPPVPYTARQLLQFEVPDKYLETFQYASGEFDTMRNNYRRPATQTRQVISSSPDGRVAFLAQHAGDAAKSWPWGRNISAKAAIGWRIDVADTTDNDIHARAEIYFTGQQQDALGHTDLLWPLDDYQTISGSYENQVGGTETITSVIVSEGRWTSAYGAFFGNDGEIRRWGLDGWEREVMSGSVYRTEYKVWAWLGNGYRRRIVHDAGFTGSIQVGYGRDGAITGLEGINWGRQHAIDPEMTTEFGRDLTNNLGPDSGVNWKGSGLVQTGIVQSLLWVKGVHLLYLSNNLVAVALALCDHATAIAGSDPTSVGIVALIAPDDIIPVTPPRIYPAADPLTSTKLNSVCYQPAASYNPKTGDVTWADGPLRFARPGWI